MRLRLGVGQLSLLCVLFISGLANAAGTASVDTINVSTANVETGEHSGAKQWFVKHYAPVWKSTHSLSAKALAPLYHHQGFMRFGEHLLLWQQPESIEQLLQELNRQQWLNAKVLSIQAHKIGPSTQSLNVVWQSEYKSTAAQISCEWYLLEQLQQQWKIIGQRYIGC